MHGQDVVLEITQRTKGRNSIKLVLPSPLTACPASAQLAPSASSCPAAEPIDTCCYHPRRRWLTVNYVADGIQTVFQGRDWEFARCQTKWANGMLIHSPADRQIVQIREPSAATENFEQSLPIHSCTWRIKEVRVG